MNIQSLLKQSSGLKGQSKLGNNSEVSLENGMPMEFAELLGNQDGLMVEGQEQALQAMPALVNPEQSAVVQANVVQTNPKIQTELGDILNSKVQLKAGVENTEVVAIEESDLLAQLKTPSLKNGESKNIDQILAQMSGKKTEAAQGIENPKDINQLWGRVNREEVGVVNNRANNQGALVQKSEAKSADLMMTTPEQVVLASRGPQVASMMSRQKAIQSFDQFGNGETPFIRPKANSVKNNALSGVEASETKPNDLFQTMNVSMLPVAGNEALAQSNLTSQNNPQVLDLSQLKIDQGQGADKIIGQISDYISINRLQMNPKLEIQFNHDELGQVGLQVERTGSKSDDLVNIMVSTQTPEAKEFFSGNQDKLVQHLSNVGIEVNDFTMDAKSGSFAGNSSGNSSSDQSSDSPSSQSSFARTGGSEAGQKREDSERRKNLWELFKDQKELA